MDGRGKVFQFCKFILIPGVFFYLPKPGLVLTLNVRVIKNKSKTVFDYIKQDLVAYCL